MRRGIFILISVILACSFISAASVDILFNEAVKPVYNLGDTLNIPITISSSSDTSGTLRINLVCEGVSTNILTWEDFPLEAGYPRVIPYSLRLTREKINQTKERCNIYASFGTDSSNIKISSDFKVSSQLDIDASIEKTEVDAGEEIKIMGRATKKTSGNSNGFVEVKIISDEREIIQTGLVNNGLFDLVLALPRDLKAGRYYLSIRAYEKDSNGFIANEGTIQKEVYINQVPTNIELVFETKDISPKEPLKVKIILRDQTGEMIESALSVSLKDISNKIIEKKEVTSGEVFEYLFKGNEPPSQWKIFASSGELEAEDKFRIKENEEVDVQITNKTILVTNIGNVIYNKTLFIKIGDSPLNIDLSLRVGESKKYIIQAPNGKYEVVIFNGEDEISQMMGLTGEVVGIKEASNISLKGIVWAFIILALLSVTAIFFKKNYKQPFFGRIIKAMHITAGKRKDKFRKMEVGENEKMVPELGNKAELSLSIKGEKQDASVVCLKIKNLGNIKSKKGSGQETLKKIIEDVKNKKAVIYENNDYLFIILAPSRTKTFKNEKPALDLAGKIKEVVENHNRTFNEKIGFGISVHYGTIVGKQEGNVFKFMTMGSLVTVCKKIASLSEGEILLSEKINDLLRLHIRTEKSVREGMAVYSVKEMKKEADEATKKFINRFMEQQKKK